MSYNSKDWKTLSSQVASNLVKLAATDSALAQRLIRKGAERIPQEKANSADLKEKAIKEQWGVTEFLTEGREDGTLAAEAVFRAVADGKLGPKEAMNFSKCKTIKERNAWAEERGLI